jgi:hypothetical protein
MDQEFNDYQKQSCLCGDCQSKSRDDEFDGYNDPGSFWPVEMNDAPDILRKSMERFLIGNVI